MYMYLNNKSVCAHTHILYIAYVHVYRMVAHVFGFWIKVLLAMKRKGNWEAPNWKRYRREQTKTNIPELYRNSICTNIWKVQRLRHRARAGALQKKIRKELYP